MKTNVLYIAVAFSLAIAHAALAQPKPPKGWFLAGSHPREYVASVDREMFHSGNASAHFESAVLKTGGFGTLMQMFQAGDFRGKRVRMSGYVQSRKVQDWAGLWMRVDGRDGKSLAFDNMQDRPIKATTDWTKYEIVLDVPPEAAQIAYGVLLSGRGDLWMDDVKFDIVAKDVSATTREKVPNKIPDAPVNLDFEQD